MTRTIRTSFEPIDFKRSRSSVRVVADEGRNLS